MARKLTTLQKLLKRLGTGKNLTVAEATRLGIPSVSKRVYDLRVEGFDIRTNRIKSNGRTVSAYRLVGA